MNINDDGGRKIEKEKGRYRWDKVKNSGVQQECTQVGWTREKSGCEVWLGFGA